MELISELVKKLGISEDAAKSGAGLFFKLAQAKLSAGDFGKIAKAVPGINDLIKSAPESGGGTSDLTNLASIDAALSRLGFNIKMDDKFLPVMLSFVEHKCGKDVKAKLEDVIW